MTEKEWSALIVYLNGHPSFGEGDRSDFLGSYVKENNLSEAVSSILQINVKW
jgi:hypothetical protein